MCTSCLYTHVDSINYVSPVSLIYNDHGKQAPELQAHSQKLFQSKKWKQLLLFLCNIFSLTTETKTAHGLLKTSEKNWNFRFSNHLLEYLLFLLWVFWTRWLEGFYVLTDLLTEEWKEHTWQMLVYAHYYYHEYLIFRSNYRFIYIFIKKT